VLKVTIQDGGRPPYWKNNITITVALTSTAGQYVAHSYSSPTQLKWLTCLIDTVSSFICLWMTIVCVRSGEWGWRYPSPAIADCSEEVAAWCASHWLQLNASGAEMIWLGSCTNLGKLSTINIGSEIIKPASCVRDLGFHNDDVLSKKQHINTIAKTCFYHLRRLRQIRRWAGQEVTV